MIEQVVIPLLRQRNPESRQRAVEGPDRWRRSGNPCEPCCCGRHCGDIWGDTHGRDPALHFRHGPVLLRAVRVDLQSNTPVLLLQETEGEGRTLPIFIGTPEATAIAYALQGVTMPRPMTHDLMKDLLGAIEVGRRADRHHRAPVFDLLRGAAACDGARSGPSSRAGPPMPSPWRCAPEARSTSPTSSWTSEGIILALDGGEDEDDANARRAGGAVPPVPRLGRPEDFEG